MANVSDVPEIRQDCEASQRERIDSLNDRAAELINHEPEQALALCEESFRLSSTGAFASSPYQHGQAPSLAMQGFLNRKQGRLDLALRQSHEAAALLDPKVPSRWAVFCFRTISWVHLFFEDYPEALRYGGRALLSARALNLQAQEASALDALAVIASRAGEATLARQYLDEALALTRSAGHEMLESGILNNGADILLQAGDLEQALHFCQQSLDIARRLSMGTQVAAALDTLGKILLARGEPDAAETAIAEGLRASQTIGWELGEAHCLLTFGTLCSAQARHDEAAAAFKKALEIATRQGLRSLRLDCLRRLAEHAEARGDHRQALDHHKAHHAEYKLIHGETEARRMAVLKVKHQLEIAQQTADLLRLRNAQLTREIEDGRKTELLLKEMAETDPLTGLFNRRYFSKLADMMVAMSEHYPLSLLLIDLDHLKQINDTHGHLAGDTALKLLAESIRSSVRQADVPARYGGDEFVIMMPRTSEGQAMVIADRVRLCAAQLARSRSDVEHPLTLSIGLASAPWPGASLTPEAMLGQADQALYTAKRNGRNQTRAAPRAA